MLLMKLWNYLRGYVIIIVEGYFLEKFINICTHRQIYLWDVKILKNCIMSLKMSIAGFRKIRSIARKTKCRVRIKCRVGMPFILNRYRKRKALFAGLLVFVAIIYTLTSFIWTIEVSGNKNISTEAIVENLASMGLKPGIIKYGIKTDDLVKKMEVLMDEIAWIGISISGTKVKVEIVERTEQSKIVERDKPYNIIAAKDGVIESIVAKAGIPVVKEGDTVKKGQLLISGVIESKLEGQLPRKVHSIASVTARTWYEASSPINQNPVEKHITGRKKEGLSIRIFGKTYDLHKKPADFAAYDIERKLSIGKDKELPFDLVYNYYIEYEYRKLNLTPEEAKQRAVNEAVKIASSEIPPEAAIKNKYVNLKENENGSVTVNAIIECIEEIGTEEEI